MKTASNEWFLEKRDEILQMVKKEYFLSSRLSETVTDTRAFIEFEYHTGGKERMNTILVMIEKGNRFPTIYVKEAFVPDNA
jgi:hypothetical protein